jgi:hypothetical protein
VLKDITKLHLFVGYCPLIFALPVLHGVPEEQPPVIHLAFSQENLQPGDRISPQQIVATLSLKKIKDQQVQETAISYYEGSVGKHRFISGFHQFIVQLNNRLYNHKPGNVYLESNLLRQVQIAYAIPRRISLITVGAGNRYNHFPTDLHGQVNDEYYLISLRHEGNACRQVEAAKKIVLSDVRAQAYKKVYALGKNHMQPLKEASAFEFDYGASRHFHLPLPKNLISYRELELKDYFTRGIHKILLFKMIYSEQVNGESDTLVHIHNSYATWRYRKGLESNYLLR